jgi:hypothetical protein
MNKSTTTTKQVTFLTRYELKSSKSIIWHIENGESKRYYVTLHPNGDTVCTCKHGENAGVHAHCYHVKECQAREDTRTAEPAQETRREYTPLNGSRELPLNELRNQEVSSKDQTYHNVTVYNLTYCGFYTYGLAVLDGHETSVKTYEGWSSWEVQATDQRYSLPLNGQREFSLLR